MAKVSINVKLPTLQNIKGDLNDSSTQKRIINTLKNETLERIAVGKSPVKGVGRFKPYAAQRKGKGYPELPRIKEKFPGKKTRPVNLELSGEFLDKIGGRVTVRGPVFGMFNLSRKQALMFEAHNDGKHPDVPQRKFLPNRQGDNFVVDIQRKIKDIYVDRIKRLIKQSS